MKEQNLGTYTLSIVGLTRNLPKIKISDELTIASFVMLGDVELIEMCAEKLYVDLMDFRDKFDYIVCPEAKAIPLAHAVARRFKANYITVRKSIKGYMKNPISQDVQSITTLTPQQLVMDGADVDKIRHKDVLLLDDVVSTGGSMRALEDIVHDAGATVVARATVLLEGNLDAGPGIDGLTYIARLPIF